MINSLLLAAMAQAVTPSMPHPSSFTGLHGANANGDGIVTRDEAMAQADAMFARMDGNHDGWSHTRSAARQWRPCGQDAKAIGPGARAKTVAETMR